MTKLKREAADKPLTRGKPAAPGRREPAAAVDPKRSSTSAPPGPAAGSVSKSRQLQVTLKPGQTEDRGIADLLGKGVATSATLATQFIQSELKEVSLSDMVDVLEEQGVAINRGDFAAAERMLVGQAVALNVIFAELARRAGANMGQYLDPMERFMRLALKAQAQCRSTIESLAEMKNPHRIAFVKQANIAHGPQQVNNGAASFVSPEAPCAQATQSAPNKLLEEQHVERLDPAAQSTASRTHSHLATVGGLDGADLRSR